METSHPIIKYGLKYIRTFLIVICLLLGLLVLVALIPQEAIKENVQESAEYLCQGELFGEIVRDVEGSRIDRYADSIFLGIAYQYQSETPLISVMRSAYYHSELHNENENLLAAVTNHYNANQQYLRYWHGSNVIWRPLLVILNLKQIYILNGCLIALLATGLLILLIRKKAYFPAVGVGAGFVMTSAWFVAFSLEYTWTCLWMIVFAIVGVNLMLQKRYQAIGTFFLISGMLTVFGDFLTTETLPFTVPLLLMLWVDRTQNGQKKEGTSFQIAGKALVAWGLGYVGMWVMKWLIAALVLSENVMSYVSEHVVERVGGDLGIGIFQYIFGAIEKNVKCLFPFEYGIIGVFLGVVLVVLVIYTAYVYHGKNINWKYIFLLAMIGMIPYIRYAVLHNHSYLHYFFTYRAQMGTILAIVLVLEELTSGMWPIGKRKR